jgi:folate-binding protein YgfZ
MQPEWRSLLEKSGARVEDGRVLHFGDAEAERRVADGNLLADLSHYGMIEAVGDDSAVFLQGQTTNDVRRVDGTRSQLSGYCTPKGRLLALFRLFRHGNGLLLQLPAELLPSTLKRLRMYVLRSKVVLDDAGDRLARFGLAGPDAEQMVRAALGEPPAAADGALQLPGLTLLRLPGRRFELVGDAARLQPLWEAFSRKARPVGAAVWSLLEIRAGLPQLFAATSEAFVPQMVNLHAIDGVSFDKGCYTGQEVVARMQYLGKLKRRMYRARVAGGTPKPGDELFSREAESGQGTGKVVDAQPAPGGGYELLAVIHMAAVERGAPIHLHNENGPQLELLPLDYEVDDLSTAPAK